MKTIKLDTGVVSYRVGEGVLRFNPADPNLYARFSRAVEQLQQLEQDMTKELSAPGADVLDIMARTDRVIKQELALVFGQGNDFDAITGGVNLLSAASDGRPVVQHLFEAMEPLLLEGAKRCAAQQAQEAKAKASARRAAQ